MAESYSRGHKIICTDGKTWKYVDTGEPVSSERPCARCGRKPINGEDACLGHINGAISACCGHGVTDPIIVYQQDKKGIKHFSVKLLITLLIPLLTSLIIVIKTNGDGMILSIAVGFALVNIFLLVFRFVE